MALIAEQQPRRETKSDPLVDRLEEKFSLWRRQRAAVEHDWLMNIAFDSGHHYLHYPPPAGDTFLGRLETDPNPEAAVRRVFNYYNKLVNDAVSKLLSNPAVHATLPSTADQDTIYAADVGRRVLQHYERPTKIGLSRLHRAAARWFVVTGEVYEFAFWNRQKGLQIKRELTELRDVPFLSEFASEDQTQERVPILDKNGDQAFEVIDIGDLDVTYYNPFQVYPEPSARNLEECLELITTEIVQVGTLRSIPEIADQAKKIDPEEGLDKTLSHWERATYAMLTGWSMKMRWPGAVVLKRYYARPGVDTDWPNGKRVWWANGVKLLEKDPPQFVDADVTRQYTIPLVHKKYSEQFDSFHGRTPFSDLRSPQVLMNKMNNILEENMTFSSQQKYWIEPGTTMTPTPSDIPGQFIAVMTAATGKFPQAWDKWIPPEGMFRMRDSMPLLMEQIVNLVDVARGENLQNTQSGLQAQVLIEQSNRVFNLVVDAWNDGGIKTAQFMLALVQEHAPEDMILSIIGDDRLPMALAFQRSDLTSTDVYIVPGTGVVQSQAALISNSLNFYQAGAITLEEFRSGLNLGHMREIERWRSNQENFVSWQIDYMMKNADLPPIMPVQDLTIAFKLVTERILTPKFFDLPQPLQQVFFAYLEAIKSLNMAQQMGAGSMGAQQAGPSNQPRPRQQGPMAGAVNFGGAGTNEQGMQGQMPAQMNGGSQPAQRGAASPTRF